MSDSEEVPADAVARHPAAQWQPSADASEFDDDDDEDDSEFDWDEAEREVRAEKGDEWYERYGHNLAEQAKRLMGYWTEADELKAQARARASGEQRDWDVPR